MRKLLKSQRVVSDGSTVALRRGDSIALAVNRKTGVRRLYLYAGSAKPEKYTITAADATRLLEASEAADSVTNEAADLYALGASLMRQGKVHQGLRALAYSALVSDSTVLTAALMKLNDVGGGAPSIVTAALGDAAADVTDEEALAMADTLHQATLEKALAEATDPEEAYALDVSLDGASEDDAFDEADEEEGDEDQEDEEEEDEEDMTFLDADAEEAPEADAGTGVETASRKALRALAAAAVGKRVGNTPRSTHFSTGSTVKILPVPGMGDIEFSPVDHKKRKYRFFSAAKVQYGKGFCVEGLFFGKDGLSYVRSVAYPKLDEGIGVFRTKADAKKVADWLNGKYPPTAAEQKAFNEAAAEAIAQKKRRAATAKSKQTASAKGNSRRSALASLANPKASVTLAATKVYPNAKISPHADGGGQIEGLIVNGKGPFDLYYNSNGVVEDLEMYGLPIPKENPLWFEVQTLVKKKYYKPKTYGKKIRRSGA